MPTAMPCSLPCLPGAFAVAHRLIHPTFPSSLPSQGSYPRLPAFPLLLSALFHLTKARQLCCLTASCHVSSSYYYHIFVGKIAITSSADAPGYAGFTALPLSYISPFCHCLCSFAACLVHQFLHRPPPSIPCRGTVTLGCSRALACLSITTRRHAHR